MRDGVKLFTAIHIPKNNSEKHPIIIIRTPYSCAPYGAINFTNRWWTRGDSAYFYRNYIVVMQDVRGKFMSEGDFEDVRPFIKNKKSKKEVDESTDAYDAIDWLVKNIPDNNGHVGVFGISYPGFYATMAAASNHPALKAVSPQAPVTDWFIGDDFHHNGVFFLDDAFTFYRGFGRPRPTPTTNWVNMPPLGSNDNYHFFLNNGTFAEIKQKYLGDTIKFWNDVAANPDYNSFWKDRNARNAINNLKPASMVVGGLFDAEDCWGAWNLYRAIEKNNPGKYNVIVDGPWWHGGWARSKGNRIGNISFDGNQSEHYYKNFELPFFEFYLRGKGDLSSLAEANIFTSGDNKWHRFDTWPPANTQNKKLYLHQNGKLSFDKPTTSTSFDSYISDPMKPVPYTQDVHFGRTREYMTDDQRFASRRPDVLVYQTEILTEDLTVTGPILAQLSTSISTTDVDYVVKVIDVFPDDFKYPDKQMQDVTTQMGGYQMLVRGEIMRARYRNSFETPEAMVPNQITNVNFELPDVAHTFKKGHRIMVQIQSTWFPLCDRNPQQFINPYTCTSKDLVKSTINIYNNSVNSSAIVLPVLSK